jgi:hypothetical protein
MIAPYQESRPRFGDCAVPPATPTTAAQAAHLHTCAATDAPITDHALLVLLGQFAQHLGVVSRLQAVPLAQKTVDHAPQTRLIEFLVGILAGINHLQDLNDAPTPIVKDHTVAHAWGQKAFAHYSSVSRTLAAADATTLQAVHDALAQVSRPFLDREVLAILQRNQPVTVDIDLTGRAVSPTSTDYPDAAFGWMDDAVSKGYQSAISSLSGGPSGRLLLAAQRYAGKAKSAECLQAAVRASETTLGVRPIRRTALLEAQLSALDARVATQHARLEKACEVQATAKWKHERHGLGLALRDERYQQQRVRLEERLARTTQTVRRVTVEFSALELQQARLRDWLAQLRGDNASLVSAVTVVLRVDAGFATDANLAWLIEMGYTVLTKAHSGHTTTRLQRAVPPDACWTAVGANAEAVPLGPQVIGDGRYALTALQVRYHLPTGWRHTTLLWYGDTPAPPAAGWFGAYNARQTLEAGIKENKAVFTMRRPLVRSPVGMQLQEAFALFAANLVRWAAAWVQTEGARGTQGAGAGVERGQDAGAGGGP